jgi:hypothetical protein
MKSLPEVPYFFETSITIQPGIYRYKFFVDSKWRYDPNEDFEENIFHTQQNIIQVFPAVHDMNFEEAESENQNTYKFSSEGVRIKLKTELTGK